MLTALAPLVGAWVGTNDFRLLPADPARTASCYAEIDAPAGGHLVSVRYAWTHPDDGEQDGLLVLGPGDDEPAVVAWWGDSWHQSPQARELRGTGAADVVTVGYSYAEGWAWEIHLRPDGPDALRLSMDNVGSGGGGAVERYAAMDATLLRMP